MEIIKKLDAVLIESKKNGQYGVKSIPAQMSDLDISLNIILDGYLHINKDEKTGIHEFITIEMAWLLLCFGIRMATYSLRLSNQRHFTNGLLAISITLGILDKRELLVVLPLYCDVQKKNNLTFREVLEQKNEFTIVLENFINRSDEDKSLNCMGYNLSIDENNNPFYERTW